MAEDRYANWAGIAAVETAAGTIAFQEKLTAVGFGSKKGMLIDQIDYFIPAASVVLIIANSDLIRFAITSSSGVTNLEDTTDSRILHSGQVTFHGVGTVGNFQLQIAPISFQFFPSLIHAHQRLFLAVQGVSLASVITVRARLYWRFVDLNDREIAELVQATLLQG